VYCRLKLVEVAGATCVEFFVIAGFDEAVSGTYERLDVGRRHMTVLVDLAAASVANVDCRSDRQRGGRPMESSW